MNFQSYRDSVILRARQMEPLAQVQHALIGMITELGELGDIFKREFVYGKAVDSVNVMEECGDFLWYFVLLLDTCRVPASLLDEAKLIEAAENDDDKNHLKAVFVLTYLTGNLAAVEPGALRSGMRNMRVDLIQGALSTVNLVLKNHGYTLAECLDRNDAKLEARTGKKFDAAALLNRDTAAERAILEAK